MEEYTRLLHPKYQKMIEKRVEAVRNAIGDDVDIIAECHSRLDAQSAVQVAKIMEKYNILYFEEPTIPNHDFNEICIVSYDAAPGRRRADLYALAVSSLL